MENGALSTQQVSPSWAQNVLRLQGHRGQSTRLLVCCLDAGIANCCMLFNNSGMQTEHIGVEAMFDMLRAAHVRRWQAK